MSRIKQEMDKLGSRLREIPRHLMLEVTDKAAPLLAKAEQSAYPAVHVETGKLKDRIGYKVSKGSKTKGEIRLYSGVRKKKIGILQGKGSGKRRKRRKPNEPNYGQFQTFLFSNHKIYERVIEKVIKKVEEEGL